LKSLKKPNPKEAETMNEVNIFFHELDEEKQIKILRLFNISRPEEMNWDVIPMFVMDKPFVEQYKEIVEATPLI